MTIEQRPEASVAEVGLLTAVRRQLPLVVATALVFAAGGYALAKALPEEYSADAVVTVARPDTLPVYRTVSAGDASDRQLTIANQLHDSRTLSRAAAALGTTEASLAGRVTVTPEPQTSLIDVAATASSPSGAARAANAVVAAYRQVAAADQAAQTARDVAPLTSAAAALQEQIARLKAQVATRATVLREQVAAEFAGSSGPPAAAGSQDRATQAALQADPLYSALRAQLADTQSQRDALADKIRQVQVDGPLMAQVFSRVDPAAPPTAPDTMSPAKAATLAGLVGLLVGCALAWWRAERRRPTAASEAARLLGMPLLAELSPSRRALRDTRRLAVAAGADGQLAALAVALARYADHGRLSCLVVAPATSEGAAPAVALALASATTRAGSVALLVDATTDGRLSGAAGLQGRPGFRDLAAGHADLASVTHELDLAGRPLPFVPVGEGADPVENLPASRLAAARDGQGPLVVAAPGLRSSGRALGLGADRGALVLVTDDRSAPAELAGARVKLVLAGATVAGLVHVHGSRREPVRRSRANEPAPATPPATVGQLVVLPATDVHQP